jgi:hypothetical protein
MRPGAGIMVKVRFLPAAVTRKGMDLPGRGSWAVILTAVWYLPR